MTYITCRLTAKNRDQLRNPIRSVIEYGLPFTLRRASLLRRNLRRLRSRGSNHKRSWDNLGTILLQNLSTKSRPNHKTPEDNRQTLLHNCRSKLYSKCTTNRKKDIAPGAARPYAPPRTAVRSKNRGGSTSVSGQVRSPHISGGRRWLSCRQPAYL